MDAQHLTPEAVLEVEFREKLRGYSQEDVDAFLERVAGGVRELLAQLADARSRAEEAERRAAALAEQEASVQRTLVLAQRTADAAVAEARAEASRMVEDAEREAAERRAALDEELTRDVERLRLARDELARQVDTLESWLQQERARLRETLSETLARLDGIGRISSEPPALDPVDVPDISAHTAPEVAADDDAGTDPGEHPADVPEPEETDAFVSELRRAVVVDELAPAEGGGDEPQGEQGETSDADPFDMFMQFDDDDDERRGLASRLRRRR